MHPPSHVRPETAKDIASVHRVVTAAFGRPQEAELVDLIRARHQALVSLVAVAGEQVVGHVLVSPITIEPTAEGAYGGLAPLSVEPAQQNRGIGSMLMHEAIARSRTLKLSALFLLGNPHYYARFGFTRSKVDNEYGATDAFMALELEPGCLARVTGLAKYVSAFAEVSA